MLCVEVRLLRRAKTTWVVSGLGALVSTVGALTMRNRSRLALGSGILGFGLAHIMLGMLDRAWLRAR